MYAIFCWLATVCVGINILYSLKKTQNLRAGVGVRGSRGVLLLTSLHTAEVCVAFVFVNKACEPKSVYPVPLPHI